MAAGQVHATMTAVGDGSQVIELKDHKFLLDEKKLEQILLREDIKDLPVVLVSVAGTFRKGKSFLLNFFLRYLKSTQSAREDGSWLGTDSEALQGFGWRGGSVRNTTGIQMWPEPFICALPPGHEAGKKVAVFLMDTQGTFDNSSTMNECSIIFAISALLSSIQIYNLKNNIQEDDLQHLHLFTEYGRLVKTEGNEAPFQVLEFLVRDWEYDWEHPYGYGGGSDLLQSRLQVLPGMSKELEEVRTHIGSCFEKVSCFLMPHPGKPVTKPDYTGKISVIEPDFKDHLKVLVSSIFGHEKLEPKVINGTVVTAQSLFTYFKMYLDMFSSGSLPSTSSIVMVTIKGGLLNAQREELKQYENYMDQECGKNTPCISLIDVKELHERYKEQALNSFKTKKKMGSKKDAKPYYKQLTIDIEKRLEQFASTNLLKYRDLVDTAKRTYDDEIDKIKNGALFCVHDKDVQVIHKEAFNAAIQVFDAGQKRVTNKKDPGREDLVKNLDNNIVSLNATNEANNKQIILNLTNEYRNLMENITMADSIPSAAEIKKEHDENLAKVLLMFKEKRNRSHNYPEDIYETQLVRAVGRRYQEIVNINSSAQRRALNTALSVYTLSINSLWDQNSENLHPEELREAHNAAVNLAKKSFQPENSDRQRTARDFETELDNIIQSRYDELEDINDAKNKLAIQKGLDTFEQTFDDLKKPTWWWLLIVPAIGNTINILTNTYFHQAKEAGIEKFYEPRRNKGTESTDTYLKQLIEEIDSRNIYGPLYAMYNTLEEKFEHWVRDNVPGAI